MNALGRVPTGTDLAATTLWSSHRPCPMCAAACAFTGVGTVRWVAPDPSDAEPAPDPADVPAVWTVAANALFVAGVRDRAGPGSPTVVRARTREPEVTDLLDAVALRQWHTPDLVAVLGAVVPQVVAVAAARRRTGQGASTSASRRSR
ncbi:hypothetical protein BJF78_26585 [Pseudonocardia sp. CNS-139]|nr:hypothetical protein BJF78_26585 [Pseudonocardia sp. CNS-139]